ncbi:Aste57867_24362 [Aphanomyces stellatus]|uniref:Aste57867_24362 protein n=1 Tax=Aphanomyces stellatus TaxID=120398 RepID=A0A485LS35_9STRA|nr:hypothetical protein As57867_024286 [Aphanomyces stellatus]VFU01002.1 Aste57867_24362 [Aphanomyces stellatus]
MNMTPQMQKDRVKASFRPSDTTVLQMSTSWQSPPLAVPMLAAQQVYPPVHDDYLPDNPQLSFEAKEGQMLVQAYMAARNDSPDSPKGAQDDSACPSPVGDDVPLPVDDDETTMFSLEI